MVAAVKDAQSGAADAKKPKHDGVSKNKNKSLGHKSRNSAKQASTANQAYVSFLVFVYKARDALLTDEAQGELRELIQRKAISADDDRIKLLKLLPKTAHFNPVRKSGACSEQTGLTCSTSG